MKEARQRSLRNKKLSEGHWTLKHSPGGYGEASLGLETLGSLSHPVDFSVGEFRLLNQTANGTWLSSGLDISPDTIPIGRCTVSWIETKGEADGVKYCSITSDVAGTILILLTSKLSSLPHVGQVPLYLRIVSMGSSISGPLKRTVLQPLHTVS